MNVKTYTPYVNYLPGVFSPTLLVYIYSFRSTGLYEITNINLKCFFKQIFITWREVIQDDNREWYVNKTMIVFEYKYIS